MKAFLLETEADPNVTNRLAIILADSEEDARKKADNFIATSEEYKSDFFAEGWQIYELPIL